MTNYTSGESYDFWLWETEYLEHIIEAFDEHIEKTAQKIKDVIEHLDKGE